MSGPAVAAPPGEPLRLDHNERLFPAPELVRLLPDVPARTLTRYPDASRLERQLAGGWGIEGHRVLVTAGADDAIDRACRRYLAGGREMITVTPTFEMFPMFARLAGGRVRSIPTLDDPAPVEAIRDRLGERTGLVTVISPHNPTGHAVPVARLLSLSDRLPPDAMLLVDLAYVDFADRDPTPELLRRDNVLVVRTLSKAWGLAGLRVGFTMGSPEAIAGLREAGPPFPLAGPSLWIVERAADLGQRVTVDYVTAVRMERERLRVALLASGARPFDSEANFVLAATDGAAALHEGLLRRGIAVRRFPDFPDLIRITLPGDDATFRRLLRALDSALDTALETTLDTTLDTSR